jgi:hypothetical protein
MQATLQEPPVFCGFRYEHEDGGDRFLRRQLALFWEGGDQAEEECGDVAFSAERHIPKSTVVQLIAKQ